LLAGKLEEVEAAGDEELMMANEDAERSIYAS
jgi:hypothetical protein